MSEKLYTTTDLAHWYSIGVQHERERQAVALHELDLFWARSAELLHHDRHAEAMQLYTQCAQRSAEATGGTYREYRGGPVAWETGTPLAVNK